MEPNQRNGTGATATTREPEAGPVAVDRTARGIARVIGEGLASIPEAHGLEITCEDAGERSIAIKVTDGRVALDRYLDAAHVTDETPAELLKEFRSLRLEKKA